MRTGFLASIAFAIGCGDSSAPPSVPTVAAKLAFVAVPTAVMASQMLPPIQVEIQDASGARVTTAQSAVTLALAANPSGGVLAGTTTVNAVSGMATFSGVWMNRGATGYALAASVMNLPGVTSDTFTVMPAFRAVSAGAGDGQTCGVTPAHDAYCWGGPGRGDGTRRSRPELVGGGLSFTQVSVGDGHVCGVTLAGAAYCWGSNAYGQLGDMTITDRSSPVLVAGGLTFVAVSAGRFFTCGVTPGGAAYCWGDGSVGQRGDGTVDNYSARPALVAGGLNFAAVSAGLRHTCGVTTADVAYCWGFNLSSQLGDGTTFHHRATPVLVTGGLSFAAVTPGYQHTCGVTRAGAAYCWGFNGYGQLGDGGGTTAQRSTPGPVTGGVTFAAVSTGTGLGHTCGITVAGAAYCWGNNADGQLGDGTTTQRSSPVLVTGGVSFAAVTVGYDHTCGVTTAEAAYCWGSNVAGELGDGTTTDRSAPVRLMP